MILGAGKGERLRPLTDTCPKPLIKINHKSLIVYHIERLARCGIVDIVINLHHLGDKIKQELKSGKDFGVNITYSEEPILLETGGGIKKALPILGNSPFILVNGDIYTDYPFEQLKQINFDVAKTMEAYLILVDNPSHNLKGDFCLASNDPYSLARVKEEEGKASNPTYTYSGIAIYSPKFFDEVPLDPSGEIHPFRLSPLLHKKALENKVGAEHYCGFWHDVGSIERLRELEKRSPTS